MAEPDRSQQKVCLYLYADILGYKELLKSQPVSKISNILFTIIQDIQAKTNAKQVQIQRFKELDSLKNLTTEEKIEKNSLIYEEGEFGHFLAFDTILVYWKGFTKKDILWSTFDEFLNICTEIFLSLLCKHSILIRGAITLTYDFEIEKNIFVIKEIEKAYNIEKAQNCASIIMHIPEIHKNRSHILPIDDTFIWHSVPIKEQAIKEFKSLSQELFDREPRLPSSVLNDLPILNPVTRHGINFLNNRGLSLKKSIIKLEKSLSKVTDNHAIEKIKNTIAYLNYCISYYESAKKKHELMDIIIGDISQKPEVP